MWGSVGSRWVPCPATQALLSAFAVAAQLSAATHRSGRGLPSASLPGRISESHLRLCQFARSCIEWVGQRKGLGE